MKSLHLATPEDLPKLLPLVVAHHAEQLFDTESDHIHTALLPVLEGAPHGAVWLIGPRKAPVGYLAVSFGWSLEHGGMTATIDEQFIRRAVRSRGMGSEAIDGLAKALRDGGIRALMLEVHADAEPLQRFYRRARFELRDQSAIMTRVL